MKMRVTRDLYEVFKCLVLSDQQSKIKRNVVYGDIWHRWASNLYTGEVTTSKKNWLT